MASCGMSNIQEQNPDKRVIRPRAEHKRLEGNVKVHFNVERLQGG